jgi:catechol 2,3-dioxygenase-like lactoylglutathione lyase family enzyme
MSTRAWWPRTAALATARASREGVAASLRGITMPCLQFQRSRQYYADLLGLKITGRGRNHLLLDAGGVRLVLLDANSLPGFTRGTDQSFYIELQVPDLGAVRDRLEAARLPVYQNKGGGKLISVRDPEGNLLHLVGPTTSG